MREVILSLLAGYGIGVIFQWLKLPLPAPPLMGLIGALGIICGAWSIDKIKEFLPH